MKRVIVIGDVQGVGFRQYIRYQARKLNIRGWVRNLPDGSVEAVFLGNSENIEKMIEFAKKGPLLAEVKNIEIEQIADDKFNDFQILK